MKWIDEKRAALRVYLRERKERAEERKAAKQATLASDPHGGHGRFFLLHIPATATVLAAFVEVYWAILFCIEATGHLQGNFDIALAWNEPLRFIWNFAFSGNLFVLLGLLAATAPIVMISMVWLPVQFAMRGFGRWRRGTLIAVGLLANAIVILSGTVVMNANRQEQVRADLVVEQSAEQGRAALQARYTAVEQRWRTLTEPSNTTLQAQAARAGVAGWDAYISTARQQAAAGTITPERLALIERARGSAVAAEAYQQQMDDLTGQIAAAAPEAATQSVVRDDVGAGMNGFAQQVQVYRPPLIAIGCTLVGILGAWWTLAMLLHMNPRDVMRSGWADEAHRIEDHSQEPDLPVAPEGLKPTRRKFTEADTGEEVEETLIPAHYRKIKRGKPTKVEIKPDIPPDETGVPHDGGGRIASAAAHTIDNADEAHATSEAETGLQPGDRNDREESDQPNDAPTDTQPEPPPEEPTDSDIADYESAGISLIDTEAAAVQPPHEEEQHADSAEPDQESEQDEPPVQPRALLAAAE